MELDRLLAELRFDCRERQARGWRPISGVHPRTAVRIFAKARGFKELRQVSNYKGAHKGAGNLTKFAVTWSEKSEKYLSSLDRTTVIRIIEKVEHIREDPYRFLGKLRGERSWKLRVGDYRVLIDIDFEKNVLHVLKVGHRKNIYD